MTKAQPVSASLLRALLGFPELWDVLSKLDLDRQVHFYLLFSGGPDSTALALTLKEFSNISSTKKSASAVSRLIPRSLPKRLQLIAQKFFSQPRDIVITLVHLNHQLRPTADEEANWVRRFARRQKLDCVIEAVKVAQLAKEKKLSLEEAGRYARYELLRKHLKGQNSVGFTAHTLDDQAESVLFNLINKTGLGGLLGISPLLQEKVLRPFLNISKAEILAFLRRRRITFLTDESNLVPIRPRSFLRCKVLPLLSKLNPRVKENILATSANLRSYAGIFAWALQTVASSVAAESILLKKQLSLPLLPGFEYHALDVYRWRQELFASLSVILKHLLSGLGYPVSWKVAEELAECVRGGLPFFTQLTEDRAIEFHPSSKLLFLGYTKAAFSPLTISARSTIKLDSQEFTLRTVRGRNARAILARLGNKEEGCLVRAPQKLGTPIRERTYEAIFSKDLQFPVRVRQWLRGDAVSLPGGVGTAKLSDVFTNAKIPRIFRQVMPVVTDGNGEIIWVPGLIRSGKFWLKKKDDLGYVLWWRVKSDY